MSFDRRQKLGRNFTVGEFLVSDKFPELLAGVKLTESQVWKINALVLFGLQPIRDDFGPVIPISGFRTIPLNKAVRGKKSSQHLLAEAVDFTILGADMERVYGYICDELRWPGQVIWYKAKNFIHLALPRLGIHPIRKAE